MSATPDQIETRLAALLALVPITVVTSAAGLAAAVALPVAEIERPRRVTRTSRNADMMRATEEWTIWEYLQVVTNPDDEDDIKAIFDVASDRLHTLPDFFARRRYLQLNSPPFVTDTLPITTETGLRRRNKLTYAALRHTLPIVEERDAVEQV